MSVFKLSASQLEARIRKTALDNMLVNFSHHARVQMRRRHIPATWCSKCCARGASGARPSPIC